MDSFLQRISFPYDSTRKGQEEFLKDVYQSIINKENIMVSAPTGLGKTVSGLAPALKVAKENNLTVIALTSRQTQVNQFIKTISDIQKASKEKINFVSFIGKRNMCIHEERDLYPPQDFNDFCRKVRKKGKCGHFKNAKNEDYYEIKQQIFQVSSQSFMGIEGFVNLCETNKPLNSKCGFCPYELAGEKAFQADIVICDFNYLFQPGIRESFLGKIGRNLDECIILVDEAHNLPDRIRSSYSFSLSTSMLDLAIKELKDFEKSSKYDEYMFKLKELIEKSFNNATKESFSSDESLIDKNKFISEYILSLNLLSLSFEELIEELELIEIKVKDEKIVSHVGRVASFLRKYLELDEKIFFRTVSTRMRNSVTEYSLNIVCLDPSVFSSEILNNSYSSILMSATLNPLEMYRDILGLEKKTNLLELESPFMKENQFTVVVDNVTTKYSARSKEMFEKIAEGIEELLVNTQEKNALIFFPSYDFMDKIISKINVVKLNRRVLREQRYLSKEKKEEIIQEFKDKKSYLSKAKVLFAVTSGSFAEGLDLPEEALEVVGVVGIPLGVPDLRTKMLINYYESKFKKGQLYGYIYPAMTKIIQAAGRCIRTETDKGVIVLFDNRFLWPIYAKSYPKNWHIKRYSKIDFKSEIKNFFLFN